jgi:hypothetical protein
MYLIIEPIVSEKLDGQLHVLQNERIIIIVIIRSNGAKNNKFEKLNNFDDLSKVRMHTMFKQYEHI